MIISGMEKNVTGEIIFIESLSAVLVQVCFNKTGAGQHLLQCQSEMPFISPFPS